MYQQNGRKEDILLSWCLDHLYYVCRWFIVSGDQTKDFVNFIQILVMCLTADKGSCQVLHLTVNCSHQFENN